MKERFKNGVCVDIMIMRDNQILLMKRKNTGNDDGMYELPGGHLEKNEDLFDAMIREAKEELLIDLKRDDLKIVHLTHHYTGERLNFIFSCELNDLEPKIGEPNKCEELLWVDINKLPEETTDKVKIMIQNITNENFYDKM